jgi:hypothetical protein
LDCCEQVLPELRLVSVSVGSAGKSRHLAWTCFNGTEIDTSIPHLEFDLQEATDTGFGSARVIYAGADTHVAEPDSIEDGVHYYRVRARCGERIGPWSNTLVRNPTSLRSWTLGTHTQWDHGELVAIHRGVVRFCAARGDLLAILTVPLHYHRQDVEDHLTALIPWSEPDGHPIVADDSAVPALTQGEEDALSYGALYHPWLATIPEERLSTGQRGSLMGFSPPDGALCGMFARRAIDLGAWVAPANDPLAGVVALEPKLDLRDWTRLTAAQVNVIRHDPRGFLVLNAQTLGRQKEFRPINVRRLLILLRRLALREGTRYVFENNDADLRSLIKHRFERVLSDLYVRGAFTGADPDSAYRVIVDESVNTRQSIELGRLAVELRVAPSLPLKFIVVRLIQTGPEHLAIQERAQ